MYSLPNAPKYCFPPYTDDYPFSPEWMYVNNSCAQYPAADVRPPRSFQDRDQSITALCVAGLPQAVANVSVFHDAHV